MPSSSESEGQNVVFSNVEGQICQTCEKANKGLQSAVRSETIHKQLGLSQQEKSEVGGVEM